MRWLMLVILIVFILMTLSPKLSAAFNNRDKLLNMSLEELMDLRIEFGTYTGIEQSKFPGNIIIISRDDIALTPSRNLLDLIETYVPGAVYVMHYKGFRLGFRGMLSDQNYSYQILINGKNVNSRAYYGPLFELQEKDLSSIERVEIISGPGSAVYGPGATAGIINIITKKPVGDEFSISTKQDLNYRYKNYSLQFSQTHKHIRYNIFGSYSSSKGLDKTKLWYIDRAQNLTDNIPYGWGFMNPDWGNYGLGGNVPELLGDYNGEPEVKLNLDLEYDDFLSINTRYSTYNHAYMTQESSSEEGPAFSGHLGKYITSELKWEFELDRDVTMVSKLGFQSKSMREIALYQRDELPFNHIAQRGNSYSENNIDLQALFNYQTNEDYRFALGGEVSYEYYKPEWGMDDDSFILSLQAPIRFAVLNSNSGFYKYYGENVATVIDENIDGKMYSVFGEANIKISERFQMLLSSRLDKHEYSETAFSPRLALISKINDTQQVDIIVEQAVRMPLFTDLFAQHYLNGAAAKPEILTGSEVHYRFLPLENLDLNLRGYYYKIDQVGWIDENEFSDQVGTYDLIGFEPELKYKTEKLLLGANYSYIRQLNWDSSYDMLAWLEGLDGEEIYLKNNAENRINNFPAQALKAFANFKLIKNISFHLDGRILWDFQQNDMLDKFKDAHQEYGNPETIAALNQIIVDLHDHGYGKLAFTTNALLQWNIFRENMKIDFQVYAMNLLSHNHIRYIIQFWEPQGIRLYPRQCGFIEEPLTVGCNLKLSL